MSIDDIINNLRDLNTSEYYKAASIQVGNAHTILCEVESSHKAIAFCDCKIAKTFRDLREAKIMYRDAEHATYMEAEIESE